MCGHTQILQGGWIRLRVRRRAGSFFVDLIRLWLAHIDLGHDGWKDTYEMYTLSPAINLMIARLMMFSFYLLKGILETVLIQVYCQRTHHRTEAHLIVMQTPSSRATGKLKQRPPCWRCSRCIMLLSRFRDVRQIWAQYCGWKGNKNPKWRGFL